MKNIFLSAIAFLFIAIQAGICTAPNKIAPKVHLTGEDIDTSPASAPISIYPPEPDMDKPKTVAQETSKPEASKTAGTPAPLSDQPDPASKGGPIIPKPAASDRDQLASQVGHEAPKSTAETNALAPYVPNFDTTDPISVDETTK